MTITIERKEYDTKELSTFELMCLKTEAADITERLDKVLHYNNKVDKDVVRQEIGYYNKLIDDVCHELASRWNKAR